MLITLGVGLVLLALTVYGGSFLVRRWRSEELERRRRRIRIASGGEEPTRPPLPPGAAGCRTIARSAPDADADDLPHLDDAQGGTGSPVQASSAAVTLDESSGLVSELKARMRDALVAESKCSEAWKRYTRCREDFDRSRRELEAKETYFPDEPEPGAFMEAIRRRLELRETTVRLDTTCREACEALDLAVRELSGIVAHLGRSSKALSGRLACVPSPELAACQLVAQHVAEIMGLRLKDHLKSGETARLAIRGTRSFVGVSGSQDDSETKGILGELEAASQELTSAWSATKQVCDEWSKAFSSFSWARRQAERTAVAEQPKSAEGFDHWFTTRKNLHLERIRATAALVPAHARAVSSVSALKQELAVFVNRGVNKLVPPGRAVSPALEAAQAVLAYWPQRIERVVSRFDERIKDGAEIVDAARKDGVEATGTGEHIAASLLRLRELLKQGFAELLQVDALQAPVLKWSAGKTKIAERGGIPLPAKPNEADVRRFTDGLADWALAYLEVVKAGSSVVEPYKQKVACLEACVNEAAAHLSGLKSSLDESLAPEAEAEILAAQIIHAWLSNELCGRQRRAALWLPDCFKAGSGTPDGRAELAAEIDRWLRLLGFALAQRRLAREKHKAARDERHPSLPSEPSMPDAATVSEETVAQLLAATESYLIKLDEAKVRVKEIDAARDAAANALRAREKKVEDCLAVLNEQIAKGHAMGGACCFDQTLLAIFRAEKAVTLVK